MAVDHYILCDNLHDILKDIDYLTHGILDILIFSKLLHTNLNTQTGLVECPDNVYQFIAEKLSIKNFSKASKEVFYQEF